LNLVDFSGRDHGMPSFLNARRKCGFIANFTTFDDLIAIFPQSYIDLLKSAYESVEDIDLYVGGALESLINLNKYITGETFGCIIGKLSLSSSTKSLIFHLCQGESYTRLMGGDSYFYSHPTNPYPFTSDQLAIIKKQIIQNVICSTTALTSVQKITFLVGNPSYNQEVPCTIFPKINVSAWKE
jgi:peroxidase